MLEKIGSLKDSLPDSAIPTITLSGQDSFEQVLSRTSSSDTTSLHFSTHARDRMRIHGLLLDAATQRQLEAALQKARAKGIQESLVVTDRANFILSVKNAAVITAIPRGAPQGDVFSKIDGAVIV